MEVLITTLKVLAFWWIGHSLSLIYITVFYHRYFAHKSFEVAPVINSFIKTTGVWITGIDPAGWVCMHRLHHLHSDTKKDPHSPKGRNSMQLMIRQLKQYEMMIARLISGSEVHKKMISDTGLTPSFLYKKKLWFMPYLFHILLGSVIYLVTSNVALAVVFTIGLSGHPLQGYLVNYICHKYGKRRFDTSDDSRNSLLLGFVLFGEGFHNNHHYHPNRASFSRSLAEIDLGYFVIKVMKALGVARNVKIS